MAIDTDTDTTLSRGYDAGNYGAAYDGLGLEASLEKAISEGEIAGVDADVRGDAYRVAFILGYFSSFELSEMGDDAEAYLEALHSEHGRRCVALGWVDRDPHAEHDAHMDQDLFPPGA
jgi:hypothetical protein